MTQCGQALTYWIAGFGVRMEVHGRTFAQAVPYQDTEVFVDFEVHDAAAALLAQAPYLTADEAEYISTGSDFFRKIIPYGAMMLHACTAVVDGRAYLFSGPSGVGKSTHVGLWRQYLGAGRVQILSDDKPVLRPGGQKVWAYGVPWCGSVGQNLNMRAPVSGICFLKQGQQDRIRPLSGAEAVYSILNQTVRAVDVPSVKCLMDTVETIVDRLPIFEMECLPELEAARLSWEAMGGSREWTI